MLEGFPWDDIGPNLLRTWIGFISGMRKRVLVGLPPRAPHFPDPCSLSVFLLLAPEGYPILNTDQKEANGSLQMLFPPKMQGMRSVKCTGGRIQRASLVFCKMCIGQQGMGVSQNVVGGDSLWGHSLFPSGFSKICEHIFLF